MFHLAPGERIYIDTGAAVATKIAVSYVDSNGTNTFQRGARQATPSTATSTDASGTPATGLVRAIGAINVLNAGAANQTVTVRRHDGTDSAEILKDLPLGPGEAMQWTDESGFSVLDAAGRIKTATPESSKLNEWPSDFFKLGAGSTEAAGVLYLYFRDTGFPGQMAIGTPGVAGRALTYSGESGAGFLDWRDPASGNRNYLKSFVAAASGACSIWLADLLWVNSGLVVTTTTSQTVNSVAWPARDRDEASDGRGVIVGVLVTGATTNGAAVTTITMSYTNSDGVAGRTATIASFPATCTAGSLILFQLEAGDVGVQSVQSIALGTSLVSGSISLVALRRIAMAGAASAWVANPDLSPGKAGAGIGLPNDMCLIPMIRPQSATTYNIEGVVTIEERG